MIYVYRALHNSATLLYMTVILVYKWIVACMGKAASVLVFHIIIESVDFICRDSVDAQYYTP